MGTDQQRDGGASDAAGDAKSPRARHQDAAAEGVEAGAGDRGGVVGALSARAAAERAGADARHAQAGVLEGGSDTACGQAADLLGEPRASAGVRWQWPRKRWQGKGLRLSCLRDRGIRVRGWWRGDGLRLSGLDRGWIWGLHAGLRHGPRWGDLGELVGAVVAWSDRRLTGWG